MVDVSPLAGIAFVVGVATGCVLLTGTAFVESRFASPALAGVALDWLGAERSLEGSGRSGGRRICRLSGRLCLRECGRKRCNRGAPTVRVVCDVRSPSRDGGGGRGRCPRGSLRPIENHHRRFGNGRDRHFRCRARPVSGAWRRRGRRRLQGLRRKVFVVDCLCVGSYRRIGSRLRVRHGLPVCARLCPALDRGCGLSPRLELRSRLIRLEGGRELAGRELGRRNLPLIRRVTGSGFVPRGCGRRRGRLCRAVRCEAGWRLVIEGGRRRLRECRGANDAASLQLEIDSLGGSRATLLHEQARLGRQLFIRLAGELGVGRHVRPRVLRRRVVLRRCIVLRRGVVLRYAIVLWRGVALGHAIIGRRRALRILRRCKRGEQSAAKQSRQRQASQRTSRSGGSCSPAESRPHQERTSR